MMDLIRSALSGKRVLLTGHTGFKGAWLSLWLKRLGADVHGLALAPQTDPSLFEIARIAETLDHTLGDIRDYPLVRDYVASVRPDLVLHLAAQPLVRRSYNDPLETFAVNVMGTAHVLDAVRERAEGCAVVVVSSDKCYDNRGWSWGYREIDPLGGEDPYSASKGATELVAASWRSSFFGEASGIHLATARAGNVIGGGDWAADRIVPDCIGAFLSEQSVELRNPNSTRPWQHVLEPLSGYLLLAARLLGSDPRPYCGSWNFGPNVRDVRSVATLVEMLAREWPGGSAQWHLSSGAHPPEARALALNCDKAAEQLNWFPTWPLEETAARTVSWYHAWSRGDQDMQALTLAQIAAFEAAADAASKCAFSL